MLVFRLGRKVGRMETEVKQLKTDKISQQKRLDKQDAKIEENRKEQKQEMKEFQEKQE